MREYSFLSCRKEQHDDGFRVVPIGRRTYRLTHRLAAVLERFSRTCAEAFPKTPAARVGVIVESRNGGSGYWQAMDDTETGPMFVIELDFSVDGNEAILAHEMAHPILRCMGVPSGFSLGDIDGRIGDEFTSTCHHPFVFDYLDQVGYRDEQRAIYMETAKEELRKLQTADFGSVTYMAPPGQVWLALWYFNFYILARSEYDAIRTIHMKCAPAIAKNMDLVLDSWMLATKKTGSIKRTASAQVIRAFQSHMMRMLDLDGRVGLESLDQWRSWLLQRG